MNNEDIKFMKKYDWFTKDGEPVILNGVALRDIDKGEELVSYGKISMVVKNA